MNETVKHLALRLLKSTWAFEIGRLMWKNRLVVLTYHRVLPGNREDYRVYPPNSIFSSEFEQQISYISRYYHVLSGEELRTCMESGVPIPPHSILLTFDDGYENNYTTALPILRNYGAPAIFFLTTGLIGGQDTLLWFDRMDAILSINSLETVVGWCASRGLPVDATDKRSLRNWIKKLSRSDREEVIDDLEQEFERDVDIVCDRRISGLLCWEQVCEMVKQGMTIGSHTASHQILASSSAQEVDAELRTSRELIQQQTGQTCWAFSYPNGEVHDFRPADKIAVRSAGYSCAFSQIEKLVPVCRDFYALPRVTIPDFCDFNVFLSRLTGIYLAFRF